MKRTKWFRAMALSSVMVIAGGCLSGCGSSETSNQNNASAEETVETVAQAAVETAAAPADATADKVEEKTNEKTYPDTITLVWYPNECAQDYDGARAEVSRLVEQATGKKVEQKMTTDYSIAIESLANGTAQIGCVMGAQGYIEAKNANDAVDLLFVNSGVSGTLDDALYYSFMSVNSDDAEQYKNGDSYAIDNIVGKRMSFVSNSSTSGFKVPTNAIITHFSDDSK